MKGCVALILSSIKTNNAKCQSALPFVRQVMPLTRRCNRKELLSVARVLPSRAGCSALAVPYEARHASPLDFLVAGAKFRHATTTFVENQKVKTPLIVSWTSHS